VNYRHAYHAGNFADVLKHAALVQLILRLRAKETPFCVIDIHAGRGIYDLASPEAAKTGEHLGGVARLRHSSMAADYLDIVAGLNGGPTNPPRLYPGSPRIARALLRPQDCLILAELHPEEHAALRRVFARDRQVSVHQADAYQTLKAVLPPKERRGLVLIDPPFEAPDEFAQAAQALAAAWRRWPTGIFALWYPIKQRPAVWQFHDAVAASGVRRVLLAEFLIRPEDDWNRLNGCGMLFVNPPWQLDDWLRELLPTLAADLAEPGAPSGRVDWLVGE
jgi:23S rRNA (adenine2030-N6)-methyltransferase